MKKTFQKELKTTPGRRGDNSHQNGIDDHAPFVTDSHDNLQQTQSNPDDRRTPIEFFAPSSSTMSPFSSSKGSTLNNSSGPGAIEEELGNSVDIQYLKHVIFKFLTSKEYEVDKNLNMLTKLNLN